MSTHRPPMLSHVGLYVTDMQRMLTFYTALFDLKVTDKGRGRTFKSDLIFLSANPENHHQ